MVGDTPYEIAAFLRTKPASALPGIGPQTAKSLARYGITTIGDIADTPPATLQRILGTTAPVPLLLLFFPMPIASSSSMGGTGPARHRVFAATCSLTSTDGPCTREAACGVMDARGPPAIALLPRLSSHEVEHVVRDWDPDTGFPARAQSAAAKGSRAAGK